MAFANDLLLAILVAICTLLLREIFTWKGEARNETIKRSEILLTECYGKLVPIIENAKPTPNQIELTASQYKELRKVHARFFFRVPESIKIRLDTIVFQSKPKEFGAAKGAGPDIRYQYLEGDSETDLVKYWEDLRLDIGMEQETLSAKISRLEETYQTLKKKIWFNFYFW